MLRPWTSELPLPDEEPGEECRVEYEEPREPPVDNERDGFPPSPRLELDGTSMTLSLRPVVGSVVYSWAGLCETW